MGVGEQLELPLPELYAFRLLMERKIAAARKLCAELSIKAVADALDQIWGPLGHPVSASTLANALRDHERNYFRSEWDLWFVKHSEEFREVVLDGAGSGKAKLTAEEKLAALESLLKTEFGAQGLKLLRKVEGL